MTTGFFLGESHRRAGQTEGPDATGPAHHPPISTAQSTPAGRPSTAAPSTPASHWTPATPTSYGCPAQTQHEAAELGVLGDLKQVLKIRTDNGTIVWICQARSGRLFYQGKTGGPDTPLEQGRNGLFLSRVNALGDDHYRAYAANGNRFDVTRVRLRVWFADGRVQTNEVVAAE